MSAPGHVSIFVSYAHSDAPWMERFRKELRAALYDKATIWCDRDIPDGTDWRDRLAIELHRADAALILATSDYLGSEWCRRELRFLSGKFKESKTRNVFWVQLKPCAWEHTELASLQSRSGVSRRALNELEDESACEREVVEIVKEICGHVDDITRALDPQLAFAKSLLGDQAFDKGLSIESIISDEGDFAIVCRGRNANQQDVAIKVMRKSPIAGLSRKLAESAQLRQRLRDPGFIRLYDSFLVNDRDGEHLVLVTEYMEGVRLTDAFTNDALRRRFSVDYMVTLIRRAAEALRELYRPREAREGAAIAEPGYGAMMPKHVFYDARLERLRFSALSVSNFARDVLGWRKFALLVDQDSARYVAPEQIRPSAGVDVDPEKSDQYLLGRLAVEMLDGGPGADAGALETGDHQLDFTGEPLAGAGPWKMQHPQLAGIVRVMLQPDPARRWRDMDAVVRQLRSVEQEARALAKSAYMRWIEGDERFFREFYERFFGSAVAQAANSRAKFRNPDAQHEKLRWAMASVLNYYPGNEPTSLRYVVGSHRDLGVTDEELAQFKLSFLELLKERLEADATPADGLAGKKQEAYAAWESLFDQVLLYFQREGKRPGGPVG